MHHTTASPDNPISAVLNLHNDFPIMAVLNHQIHPIELFIRFRLISIRFQNIEYPDFLEVHDSRSG
jgi:hypothetical protein